MQDPKRGRRAIVGLGSLVCLLIVGTLSFASVPAGAQSAPTTQMGGTGACPVLSLGNPNPGDTLTPGGLIISGTAFDPAARQGAGIARVDLFLGERENGGMILGSAVPGSSGGNPEAFSVEVQVPNNFNRGVDFAAYAISAVTGQESVVTFPVFVGTPTTNGVATPTPVPTTLTQTNTCGSAQPASTTSSAPAAAPTSVSLVPAPSASGATSSTGGCPVLSLGNPSPGDTVEPGGLVISGTAYDPSATQGAGIARVDLFLGTRESGGEILGSAVPGEGGNPRAFSIEVQVPKLNRGVDLAAYAISAVTGQETGVSFPVFVGAPTTNGVATPTPIPTTETVFSSCSR